MTDHHRALTLWQPWASLIALRVKTVETRSWTTDYRGPLWIHAAARRPTLDDMLVVAGNVDAWNAWHAAGLVADDGEVDPGPLGALVARANLVDVLPIRAHGEPVSRPYVGWSGAAPGDPAAALHVWQGGRPVEDITGQAPYGDYRLGRYAWALENIEPVRRPVPARGRQRIWHVTGDALGRSRCR